MIGPVEIVFLAMAILMVAAIHYSEKIEEALR